MSLGRGSHSLLRREDTGVCTISASRSNKELLQSAEADRLRSVTRLICRPDRYGSRIPDRNFLDDIDALQVPYNLAAALEAQPEARRHFDGFPPASRRFVLCWIKLAKKPETRRKRIDRIATLAAKNERLPGS